MYHRGCKRGWGALGDMYPVGDVTIPTTNLLYIGLLGYIAYKFFLAHRSTRRDSR